MWFFRKRRRRKLLAEPIPAVWRRTLQEHMVHFRMLGPRQREKLENKARVFVAETNWEGCGGLDLDDRMRILIAANACLLVLENDATLFEHIHHSGRDLQYFGVRPPLMLDHPSGAVS